MYKWVTLLTLSLLFSFLFVPSAEAASSIWLSKGTTQEKTVALTIDDGSDGANYARILSVLDKHNVKATFFLTGSGAEHHPQLIKNTVSKGHGIGNHSYNHPNFTQLSSTDMINQLNRTETIVKNLTGKSTKPYFRAPYGSTNNSVLNTVGNAGYTYTFHWTIDTLDWTGNSATTIYNRVMNNIVPGAIVLMHTGAGASGTVEALDRMIPALKNRGYRFVTIAQLLKHPTSPTLPSTGSTYTVRSGDTLYAIARRFNTTISKLAQLNNITNVNLIRVGQVLRISETSGGGTTTPPSTIVTYTIKSGDTLYALARRFNTTVTKIAQTNHITNIHLIRVGQVLRIAETTSGTTSPPTTVKNYTVRTGDTLYAIANRYQTTILRIAQLNNISNVNLIRVGQVLQIP